eukprot:s568_g4.t1
MAKIWLWLKKTGMDRYAVIRTYGTKELHKWSHMDSISSKRYGSRVWDMGYGPGVWIACGSGVWIGTLHFELQPYLHPEICYSNCPLVPLTSFDLDTSSATVDHNVQPASKVRKAGATHIQAVPVQLDKLFATCRTQHELSKATSCQCPVGRCWSYTSNNAPSKGIHMQRCRRLSQCLF